MHDHSHEGHDHREPGHGHGLAGGHSHAPARFGTAFAIGTTLNFGFVLIEAAFGVLGHSMALVADAGHNLGDVLGLLLAWIAAVLARRAPSARYTYGLGRGTILAALTNAVILLVSVGGIAAESLQRLIAPVPPKAEMVMVIAAIGIVVNGITAWLFMAGRKHDLNLRAAFVHMAADMLVSAGVVAAGAVILLTGWVRIDPIVGLVIAAVILAGTWSLLRDSVGMAVDGVPSGIQPEQVRRFLERQPGVASIHDLHIWAMSTTQIALTGHLVMPGDHPGDEFLGRVAAELGAGFGIGHVTLQIELDAAHPCALASDEVV